VSFPWLPESWRGPVIVVGALTDLGDGALSRYCGMASRTGRVIDPIADKLFVAGVVTAFLLDGLLTWGECLLVAARDLVVVVGTLIGLAGRHWDAFQRMGATWLGKVTTAAQFAFFAVLVVDPVYRDWLFLPTAALSVAAGLQYLWLFVLFRRASA
jgi:cardiolipin synthase